MVAIKTDLLNLWQDRTNIYHWYPYVASLLGIIIDLFLIPMTYQPNPVLDYIVFPFLGAAKWRRHEGSSQTTSLRLRSGMRHLGHASFSGDV